MKHTPGAWEVKREGTFHHRIMLRKGDYCPMIADVHAGENIANLMASAPEMYEALKSIPDHVLDCGHKYPHTTACFCCVVKAVIAKAEGIG